MYHPLGFSPPSSSSLPVLGFALIMNTGAIIVDLRWLTALMYFIDFNLYLGRISLHYHSALNLILSVHRMQSIRCFTEASKLGLP